MSDDLLKRLKEQHHNTNVLDGDLMRDAAAEITRLRERLAEADKCNRRVSDENEKLREALKPFADYSDCLNEEEEETGNLAKEYDNQPVKIHYLRAAAAAIKESGK